MSDQSKRRASTQESDENLLNAARSAYERHGRSRFIVVAQDCPEDADRVSLPAAFFTTDKKLKYGIVQAVGDALHAKPTMGRARFFAWLLGRREQDKDAIDEFDALGKRLGAWLSDRIQAGMTLPWESDPCTAWIAFLLRSEGLHEFIEEGEGYSVLRNPFGATVRTLTRVTTEAETNLPEPPGSTIAAFLACASEIGKLAFEVSEQIRDLPVGRRGVTHSSPKALNALEVGVAGLRAKLEAVRAIPVDSPAPQFFGVRGQLDELVGLLTKAAEYASGGFTVAEGLVCLDLGPAIFSVSVKIRETVQIAERATKATAAWNWPPTAVETGTAPLNSLPVVPAADEPSEASAVPGGASGERDTTAEMPSAQKQPTGPSKETGPVAHSTDFRSVKWFGAMYSFTVNQAPVVRLLYQNWQAGTPDVGDETLLAEVDPAAPPARLSTLFRAHPAWGTMIVPGGSKGTHRLAPAKTKS